MNPISLSTTSVTWTSMTGLIVGCFVLGVVHALWTWLERRYLPIDERPAQGVPVGAV